MNRPETIEETAALMDEAGGRGIAVQVVCFRTQANPRT
jgi:hypothetical protein